jgi:putative peptidoglycan lipid II flippase
MTHIFRSSLILATFFAIDKVLGFIRQLFVARQFGLTYEIDVFNAANNIPDLLSLLISGGALGVALIPVLSEYLEKQGRQQAWLLFSRIVNLAFLVTAAISALIILMAGPLVRYVIVPGFPAEQQALTVELMRLDLIAIVIFSISGLAMAGLQANQHFLLPALAPGLYNIGQIFGITILAPSQGYSFGPVTLPAFGLGIHGLVYGVIIGALLHLLIQVPGLLRHGFRWSASIKIKDPGVVKVLVLMGPRVLTMVFLHFYIIARDNLASGLGEGAVTALNYGWFIMQVPETLIGSALAIVILPTVAELFARGDTEGFRRTLNSAFRVIFGLTIPSAALLAVALPPLVQTLFGFDPAGTELVVWATRAYLLGLVGHALLETAARSFYAQQNAVTPMLAAALNAVIYIILAISLANLLQAPGIALANSLAFSSEALLLIYLLNRRHPGITKFGRTLLRVSLASAGGAGLVYLLLQLPLPTLLGALVALSVSGLIVLPFIWPEIKILIQLGPSDQERALTAEQPG